MVTLPDARDDLPRNPLLQAAPAEDGAPAARTGPNSAAVGRMAPSLPRVGQLCPGATDLWLGARLREKRRKTAREEGQRVCSVMESGPRRTNKSCIRPTLPGMTGPETDDWEWDDSLFEGTAAYYERGRLPYSPALPDALRDALGLDGRGRLLDVGCGPGTITLRLAHLFEEVVGLDADRGMIAEATRLASKLGVTNATWVQLRAEALPADLGTFRVVTFAASFHWMDRPRVAAAVKTMLEPGGAVVQVDAPGYRLDELQGEAQRVDLPHPPPPDAQIDELRRRYLGPDRRAGKGIRNTSPSGENEVFVAAGFAPGRRVLVPDGRVIERTPDEIVAGRFSTAASAPHLFGDRCADFETDLRALLAEASPSGRFAVRLPDNVLWIWTLQD